jgi:diguanylate cyclase
VDILKMDGSFTANHVGGGASDQAFVRAIVELASSLGLRTIAEAVETAEQADRLALLGCDMAQGYHFARPEPPEVVEEILAAAARFAGGPTPGGAARSPNSGPLDDTRPATRPASAVV